MITPITNHVEQAIAKLTGEFRKPRWAQMTASHVRPFQAVEDAAWEVYGAWDVDTCEEYQLGVLARIVGQPRVTSDLERFRLYVKARAAVNRSRGKTLDVVRIARSLFAGVAYSFAPQTLLVSADALDLESARIGAGLLREAMPVTYRLLFVWPSSEGEGVGQYSSAVGDTIAPASSVYGSTIDSSGTLYAAVL